MKRIKVFVILLTLSMTTLLSGCIQFNISTGVDADFNAFLIYRIEMDVGEVDLRSQNVLKNSLNRIGWHYQEYFGFIVELDIESDNCLLVMTKKTANSNLEQAFKSLEELLTNEEITPFMYVDTAFNSTGRQSRFLITAATDISQIIRLSNVEELSPALFQQFEEAVKTGSGTISVTLPVSELVSSSHQVSYFYNLATMTVPLNYSESTDFELKGVVNYLHDGTIGGTTAEIIQEQTMLRNISFLAAGALTVILFIVLLARALRKKSY